MTDDTISRAAALNECLELAEARRNWGTEEGQAEIRGIDAVMCALHDLPSAQPSVTDTNVGGTDCISRQAALTALRTCYDTNLIVLDNGDELIHYGDAVGAIEALPSAQTELENKIRAIGYTGREGRIYIGGRLFAVRELPQ